MNTISVLILILIAAVIVIALLARSLIRTRRSQELRTRFGPEYDRTIQQYGQPLKAERDLLERQKRLERLHIRSLNPAERDRFADLWQGIQAGFVDDPATTIRQADRLVVDVMTARGYPMVEFDGRADDLSVEYPHLVTNYRAAHEVAVKQQSGTATTEDLRQAVMCYRALFEELLERHVAPSRA